MDPLRFQGCLRIKWLPSGTMRTHADRFELVVVVDRKHRVVFFVNDGEACDAGGRKDLRLDELQTGRRRRSSEPNRTELDQGEHRGFRLHARQIHDILLVIKKRGEASVIAVVDLHFSKVSVRRIFVLADEARTDHLHNVDTFAGHAGPPIGLVVDGVPQQLFVELLQRLVKVLELLVLLHALKRERQAVLGWRTVIGLVAVDAKRQKHLRCL